MSLRRLRPPGCLLIGLLLSQSPGFGQQIQPPPGWKAPPTPAPGTVRQFFSTEGYSGFSPNLVVTRGRMPCCNEDSVTVDSLIAKVAHQQARIMPLFKVLEKGRKEIGGRAGGFMVSSYARSEEDLAIYQFFFLDRDEFVNVVYTCALEDLQRLRPSFDKSLGTFKADSPRGNPAKPAKAD